LCQLAAFRQLLSRSNDSAAAAAAGSDEFDGRIVNNYRPTMPVNDRLVLASFN